MKETHNGIIFEGLTFRAANFYHNVHHGSWFSQSHS